MGGEYARLPNGQVRRECQFESALDFLCRGRFHSSRAPDINDRSSTPNVRLDIPAVIFQTIFERRG
jgi:hypothetical protein